MRVDLIARTHLESVGFLHGTAEYALDPIIETVTGMEVIDNEADADTLVEFAGRACYQSFHRPNPKTARNEDYLANILNQGHESVLEHASATFYVTGVSRSLTHELIRHRHLSFSELSQRYVDMTDWQMVMPPAVREKFNDTDEDWVNLWADYAEGYSADADQLMSKGLKRKQAREAARWQLPNATETRIVVTGNLRAWRDVLRKRWSVHADAEIREFAGEVLAHLREIAPNSFQDIPEEPYE